MYHFSQGLMQRLVIASSKRCKTRCITSMRRSYTSSSVLLTREGDLCNIVAIQSNAESDTHRCLGMNFEHFQTLKMFSEYAEAETHVDSGGNTTLRNPSNLMLNICYCNFIDFGKALIMLSRVGEIMDQMNNPEFAVVQNYLTFKSAYLLR